MGLNIKSDGGPPPGAGIGGLTGESMTAAVTEAVRERLERIAPRARSRPGRALAGNRQRLCCAPDEPLRIGRPWRFALRRARVAAMIVDTSALIAILRGEPEAAACARRSRRASSTPHLGGQFSGSGDRHRRQPRSDRQPPLRRPGQGGGARDRAGHRGSGEDRPRGLPRFRPRQRASRAAEFRRLLRLCVGKATGEPLLFKGNDFVHTDIAPAVR